VRRGRHRGAAVPAHGSTCRETTTVFDVRRWVSKEGSCRGWLRKSVRRDGWRYFGRCLRPSHSECRRQCLSRAPDGHTETTARKINFACRINVIWSVHVSRQKILLPFFRNVLRQPRALFSKGDEILPSLGRICVARSKMVATSYRGASETIPEAAMRNSGFALSHAPEIAIRSCCRSRSRSAPAAAGSPGSR